MDVNLLNLGREYLEKIIDIFHKSLNRDDMNCDDKNTDKPRAYRNIVDGITRFDRCSWDAYSEGKDLELYTENYFKIYGFYPESIYGDKAYGIRENRKYCKLKGIRYAGSKLGNPKQKSIVYNM